MDDAVDASIGAAQTESGDGDDPLDTDDENSPGSWSDSTARVKAPPQGGAKHTRQGSSLEVTPQRGVPDRLNVPRE